MESKMDGMEKRERRAALGAVSNQHGAALVLAMVVLTTLALVALFLGSQASINRRIASDDMVKSKALRYAEAGIAEATARLQQGLGPDPYGATPALKVVQILNATTVGAVGADTTLLTTGQPGGQWLTYSTSTKGANALTIEFKTNPARTAIYKYDKTLNPPVQTTKGAPIFKITSTGRVGTVRRTIVAEMCWNPVVLNTKGALTAGEDTKFSGNAVSCGYDHRIDTPVTTGASGRAGAGGCNENPAANPPLWELPSSSVTGIWCGADATPTGAANAYGSPAISNNQAPFYAGPWEALGMTAAQFWAWVGSPIAAMPGTPNGVYYLDNDATKQNKSGDWNMNDGQGFLYADGDITLHANWRGLIYCEGDLKLNGPAWVLGGVVSRGNGHKIQFNGGATILYSYDAIARNLGNRVTWRKPSLLSWKEQ
jgi:Tfp pilus assembly protein PilX